MKDDKKKLETVDVEEELVVVEDKLCDEDLNGVSGGLEGGSIRKRDVHGHPLTYGPEGYIRPLKG